MVETVYQLRGWVTQRESVTYPYVLNKKGKYPDNGREPNWELIAEGTKEQMLAYWKLLDPVSWAKERKRS